MKAITQRTYGNADVLELTDIPRPTPGKGEVLVEVRAAGCGPDVWHIMTGTPYFGRPAMGWSKPKWAARGRDVAGVVAEVGPGVTEFAVGDEVYGACTSGSFAEFAIAPAKKLARKPASLSFVEAAAVPVSAGTALQGLQKAGVGAGSRVLVIGAAGGVGSFAVQIAVALGATVTGVCSAGKADLVRSLGASDVIDYAREEIDRDGAVYDAIIDTAGNRSVALLRTALKPEGALVIVGGESGGGPVFGGFERQLLLGLRSPFVKQKLIGLISTEQTATYDELTAMIDAGQVKPSVGRVYPLADAADAVRAIATNHTAGKLVIEI